MHKNFLILLPCLLYWSCIAAQPPVFLDLGKIREYDTILKRVSYFIDYSKKITIDDISSATFSYPDQKFPIDPVRLEANYFIKLAVTNSSLQDKFCLYMGRAQRYTMYEYDSAASTMKALNNQLRSFSYTVYNNIPYAFFIVKKGESKVFYIQADINFYNWHQFDPVIVLPNEETAFAFTHFLQPNRLYIYITIALLGIMFSMFAYTLTIFLQNLKKEYLYYSGAMFIFVIYFLLRLLNIFMFGDLYYFLYDVRYQLLQLTGSIFVLLFIASFLGLKEQLPRLYKHFRIIIIILIVFLAINLPITYTNRYNHTGNIAFNAIRMLLLMYSVYLTVILLLWKNKKEVRYLAIGVLIAVIMSGIAFYFDNWKIYEHRFFEQAGIPVLIFMLGIILQLFLFMQALSYIARKQDAERIIAVEQLQLENDRKELEIYRVVIEARDKERNRISQEIHDDIGSGLTSIRLLSEIAKTKSSPANSKELEKISTTSNELMDTMNEIIWTLNSRNDTLPNLIAYLRHLVVEYFESLQTQLHIITPDNVREVTVNGKVRRNILLSVKEILHNIVKHSQATVVYVQFTEDDYFSITITDNGIGFNPSLTTLNFKNGLQNIRERLASIGGTCTISNNGGTSILLKVPLTMYPL